jgi:hypothetical protein
MVAYPRLTRAGQRATFHLDLNFGVRERAARLAEHSGLSYTQLVSLLVQEARVQLRRGSGRLAGALQGVHAPLLRPHQHTSCSLAPRGAEALRSLRTTTGWSPGAVVTALVDAVYAWYEADRAIVPQVRDLTVDGLSTLFEAVR